MEATAAGRNREDSLLGPVVILGRSLDLVRRLEEAGFPVAAQMDALETLKAVVSLVPVRAIVIVFGNESGGWDLEGLASWLGARGPGIDVVAYVQDADPKKTDRALSSSLGALELPRWLGLHQSVEGVIGALTRYQPPVNEASHGAIPDMPRPDRRKGVVTGDDRKGGLTHPRHWLAQPATGKEPAPRDLTSHDLVLVYSPKGGVGKTFIACNLAVALARAFPGRVALLDLDFGCADAWLYLDMASAPSIVDLLPYSGEMGPDLLDRYMATHKASGLKVLLGPPKPETAQLIREGHVSAILDSAGAKFEYVVADMPPESGGDSTLECLRRATRVVLVTTQDAAALHATKMALEALERRSSHRHQETILVLNRVDREAPLPLHQIEGFLGVAPHVCIQEDRRAVEESVLQGRPIVDAAPSAPLARALAGLAERLYPARPVPFLEKPRGWGIWPWQRRSKT
jgi:MinD-like ATPase involved in chromosome partitioning or flagellar assembly